MIRRLVEDQEGELNQLDGFVNAIIKGNIRQVDSQTKQLSD